MRNAVIKSFGAYAPENKIPNSYFNELLEEDVDTWLVENLTIKERRWCSENEATSDLSLNAAKMALERASVNAKDLDLIIVATDTPDYISPSTASVLQYKLDAVNAGTFDINTACAGFVTAIDTASKFIQADERYKNILVVGAYAMSKYLDHSDKKTVTLFADGAGAVLLSAEENSNCGFLASLLHSEGQYHDWMGIYGGGTFNPLTPAKVERKEHLLKFVKKFPKELNPLTWTRMIEEVTSKAGLKPEDIDRYFFTQININSIWQTMDNLSVPREKAHTIMDKYAYTGSACIPMAMNDAYQKDKLKPGDKIVLMGSGGGLAFACAVFKI
jgi:3-oxoacyl-[acyl-carrier-protein] synthase III